MTVYNLISFCGIFLLMGIAWLLSEKRSVVNWRVILWGVGIQLFFAVFIFILPIGTKFFLFLNKIVLKVLESAMAGTR
ncbi:MAG: nucleoside transporter, partial [Candidatus Aminicenantes bacterium]|nr:nucleoside transporter [Candidatus Aminicenantes bacterium]